MRQGQRIRLKDGFSFNAVAQGEFFVLTLERGDEGEFIRPNMGGLAEYVFDRYPEFFICVMNGRVEKISTNVIEDILEEMGYRT